MKQSPDQILFLRNMHWAGTIGGAFQRSGIYKKGSSDIRRGEFHTQLRHQLESFEKDYKNNALDTDTHIANIKRLQVWSKTFRDILNNEKLNFGISQKLLNLHLKGLWCFGILRNPPPHFPVDRIIQERLRINPIIPWTQITSDKDYRQIISKAERLAKMHKLTLAELELKVYNGTLKIQK